MKKALLILDLQTAFINEDTNHLLEPIEKHVIETYYDDIIVGKFINSIDSIFVKRLGDKKCLNKEDSKLELYLSKPYEVMTRTCYTMYTEALETYFKEHKIKYIYLCGVDTDRSIYKTALDLLERGYYVYVIKDLCGSSAGTTYHNMAIHLLKRQIGDDYVI